MANFLRSYRQYQDYFQFCYRECKHGAKFAKAEVLFHYEHGSNFRIADDTFDKLFEEVDGDDLSPYKLNDRMCCREFCNFIEYENLNIRKKSDRQAIAKYLKPFVPDADELLEKLNSFLYIEPKLPDAQKTFVDTHPVELSTEFSREQVIEYLESIRTKSETADLAFYAYRDIDHCRYQPFVKAALERNPVCVERTKSMSPDEIYNWLGNIENESIYDGTRLAQPDEVANYQRGDGLEKAFLMATVIRSRDKKQSIKIIADGSSVYLLADKKYEFQSDKPLKKEINIP
jgi:hypothetical protein